MASLDQPPKLTNPFSSSTSYCTSTTTTTTSSSYSSSPNITKSQSSAGLHNPESQSESQTSGSDGRRNSFGETLPSPTESWKPTFNRVQSWNREDRKREIVLKREIAQHEGRGGGFSEKK